MFTLKPRNNSNVSQAATRMARKRRPHRASLSLERLEDRTLLSTFTVLNTNDAGAGSLRQAILDANALSGADQIHFNIGSGGVQTIAPTSFLPDITSPVTIDGSTQPGYAGTPIVELRGDGLVANDSAVGLSIIAGASTVRALVINRFDFAGINFNTGGGNQVLDCYVGTDVSGTTSPGRQVFGIRLTTFVSGNVISGNVISGNEIGIELNGANGNVVQGNRIGTNAAGTAALGNVNGGVRILGGSNNLIGGATPEARNIISGSGSGLVGVHDFDGSGGNVIQGNYIGTDVTGTVAMGSSGDYGISLSNGVNTLIGGAAPGEGNLISGNALGGISIGSGGGSGNVVQGNRIGTNASGTAALPNNRGVLIGSSNNTIGGTGPGQANLIAFNNERGVDIQAGTGNSVRGNSIYSNGALGINLGSSAVDLSDTLDGDTGPNNLQNFPVLSAVSTGTSTRIVGSLNSLASTTFMLDFYASTAADPSGYGEGQRYLGSASATTDASGNASFDVTLSAATAAGEVLTATATDPTGSTSEFSAVRAENVCPVVGAISAPVDPVSVNVTIAVSASFTDANATDSHTAVWSWGDGTTSAGTVTESIGSGSLTGSHAYTSPGVYTLTLTVTDSWNCSAQSEFRYVVIYDPSAGFVTGGGWIDSPPGAYAADPTLAGKANFGFVSKYQPGTTVPTGNTEFQFKVADFNFKSTAYEWLVVAGARAQYKGTGTINGSGSYSFMLTAIDGDLPGGGGVDKFRIKISGPSGALYDNQTGAADDANPTTTLGGGSITMHKSALQAFGGPANGRLGSISLAPQALQPIVREAIARWHSGGVTAESLNALSRIDIQFADLPGSYLGLASPGTIWIDQNAAGWGWFIDATPRDDSEFRTPGDPGEQGRMDLLSVVMHEMGHLLGLEHDEDGVMAEALLADTRPGASRGLDADTTWLASDTVRQSSPTVIVRDTRALNPIVISSSHEDARHHAARAESADQAIASLLGSGTRRRFSASRKLDLDTELLADIALLA